MDVLLSVWSQVRDVWDVAYAATDGGVAGLVVIAAVATVLFFQG